MKHIFHFYAGWQAATVKFPAHRRHLMHCASRICCQDIAAGCQLSNISGKVVAVKVKNCNAAASAFSLK